MALPLAATIAAQPGPQTDFLRSSADICIYGGAAGGGKTVGLILEPLRYVSPGPDLYRGVFPADDAADHQSRWPMGRESKFLSSTQRDPAPRRARMALAARRQDQ